MSMKIMWLASIQHCKPARKGNLAIPQNKGDNWTSIGSTDVSSSQLSFYRLWRLRFLPAVIQGQAASMLIGIHLSQIRLLLHRKARLMLGNVFYNISKMASSSTLFHDGPELIDINDGLTDTFFGDLRKYLWTDQQQNRHHLH